MILKTFPARSRKKEDSATTSVATAAIWASGIPTQLKPCPGEHSEPKQSTEELFFLQETPFTLRLAKVPSATHRCSFSACHRRESSHARLAKPCAILWGAKIIPFFCLQRHGFSINNVYVAFETLPKPGIAQVVLAGCTRSPDPPRTSIEPPHLTKTREKS